MLTIASIGKSHRGQKLSIYLSLPCPLFVWGGLSALCSSAKEATGHLPDMPFWMSLWSEDSGCHRTTAKGTSHCDHCVFSF